MSLVQPWPTSPSPSTNSLHILPPGCYTSITFPSHHKIWSSCHVTCVATRATWTPPRLHEVNKTWSRAAPNSTNTTKSMGGNQPHLVFHLLIQSWASTWPPNILPESATPHLAPGRKALPAVRSSQALPGTACSALGESTLSITGLLYLAHYTSFLLPGLIKLRSLCNLTASLGLRTGAPAVPVVNHFIKNTGQKLQLSPLLPISLFNCLLGPFFTCSMHQCQTDIIGTLRVVPYFQ